MALRTSFTSSLAISLYYCNSPWLTVHQFSQQIQTLENLFHNPSFNNFSPLIRAIPDCSRDQEDLFIWTLEKSGSFSIKSFYKFLIGGGIHYPLYSHFWKSKCPSKITLFCWLAREDKLLTLSNLSKKRL